MGQGASEVPEERLFTWPDGRTWQIFARKAARNVASDYLAYL